MSLFVTVKSEATFETAADGFIVGSRFGLRCDVFSVEDIRHFRSLTDKPLFVNMEQILHPSDLEAYEADLLELAAFVDGVYFSDVGVYELAKRHNIEYLMIYNPSTLVTNTKDMQAWLDLGIHSVCAAKELTLEELLSMGQTIPSLEVFVHGFMVMFYSKRQVLSNFQTKHQYKKVEQATLEDTERGRSYPIIENDSGSHIFQQDPLASFDEIVSLSPYRCRIDGYLVSEEQHHFMIQCYKEILTGTPVSKVLKKIDQTFPNFTYHRGFYDKQTTYLTKDA
jgi:putative protease